MSADTIHSDAPVAFLKSKGIDPAVAESVGATYWNGELQYPNGRHRPLDGSTIQPKGTALVPWPLGDGLQAGEIALICEGETDALAALTAIENAPDALRGGPLGGVRVISLPGASTPVERLIDVLKAAGVSDVVLAFDADPAGRKATIKFNAELIAQDFGVSSVDLRDGTDLSENLTEADDASDMLANLIANARATAPATASITHARPLPELLDAIASVIQRFVVLPSESVAVVLALFVAHTYAFAGSHSTPYLLIISPEKRSGKTRLMELLSILCARPWMVAGASEAALYRKIGQDEPTLLFDEIDAVFGSATERTEPIRGLLNAGNRRGAVIPRCVGAKMDEVKDFPVYCPKVLAGIDLGSRFPETLRDRSVPIRMVRKTGAEPVERFRARHVRLEIEPLIAEMTAWADSAVDWLEEAEPDLPDELDDRKAEACEPLFAIADMARGTWPADARRAAINLSAGSDADSEALGTMMLAKLHEIFGDRHAVTTVEIVGAVNEDETLPFGGFSAGSGLDSRGLARLLKPYGVRPTSVRIGDKTPKGYRRDDLADAWARYVPDPESPQLAQQAQHVVLAATANPHSKAVVALVADVASMADTGTVVADSELIPFADPEQEAEAERIAAKFSGAVA